VSAYARFLAVDPNAKAGVALWLHDAPAQHRVVARAVRGTPLAIGAECTAARIFEATEAVIEAVHPHGSHGAGRKQIITMGMNAGRWVQACEERGMRVTLVSPDDWQRTCDAKAHRGESEASRNVRRIVLASAILRAEGGVCEGPLTVDAACAVLIGAWYERERRT